jgi:ABC-2 type transport system ATP-binding protein
MNDQNALLVSALEKSFDSVRAVSNIQMNIRRGEIAGLIGPDGAGKTTLMRLCLGLLTPGSGSILIDGIDVQKHPLKIKDRTGYMPQHFSLYGDLTVSENLRFYADLHNVPPGEFEERRRELLRFSGLAPFQKRLARNLSGGMQKKLALASNLLHTPGILFLDEPTTGVDPISRRELWSLLLDLNRNGVTILVTTPYMDEAQKCHRVGLMYEGRLICLDSPQNLIKGIKSEIFELKTDSEAARKVLKDLPGLTNVYPFGGTLHLVMEEGMGGSNKVQEFLSEKRIEIKGIKKIPPSFEDAFLEMIQKN